jgi:hypothetical protein
MYEYYKIEGAAPLFYFKTNRNNEYAVEFTEHNIESKYIYKAFELSFYIVEEITKRNDLKISKTIVQIVKDFFDEYPNSVVVYICDSQDNRQHYRNRLFNRWFLKSNSNKKYGKLNLNYSSTDINYNLELIYRQEKYNVRELFNAVIEELETYSTHK